MIRLLVSDLDGTLLDHSKKVSARELEALREMKEQGVELCLASGRMHLEIKQVMEEIGIAAHSVSQNGAYIHHKEGHHLHVKKFESELASKVYDIVKPYDLVQLICSGEGNYITHLTPSSDRIQARMFETFIIRDDMATALRSDLSTCKFSLFGELPILLQLKQALELSFGDQLTIYLADHDCLDIMPMNVSKGSSLLALLETIGLQPEEIACVGDSFNDVSMFQITPHSFAMQSAHPDVKRFAAHEVLSVSDAIRRVQALNAGMREQP
jgi:Cof subfamily protein (haloacid dehalogenase superfamily)